MPAYHLPPERLSSGVFAMQIDIAAAGIRAFGSYDRAIYFAIVLRQSMRLCAETGAPRTISIHAIATSFGRPYATVWRHIQALAAAGLVRIANRRVEVVPDAVASSAVAPFLDRIRTAFATLETSLELQGRTPRIVTWGSVAATLDDVRLIAAIDLLLCSIEETAGLSWTGVLLLGCLQTLKADRAAVQQRYGEPGDAAEAMSIRQVARMLDLPYSTTRRQLGELFDAGAVVRQGRGVAVATDWSASEVGRSLMATNARCARTVFQRLCADSPARLLRIAS